MCAYLLLATIRIAKVCVDVCVAHLFATMYAANSTSPSIAV